MGIFSRAPRPMVASAMVASAKKLDAENKTDGNISQAWQLAALSHYDNCGEVRFCSQFYARMLSRVRFFPVTIAEDGTQTQIESGPAVDILGRIKDASGGRTRLQYDYGRLMFVTGEGAMFVTDETLPTERWQFLWREELNIIDDDTAVQKTSAGKEIAKGKAYRMWTPHPRWSDLADSPLRAVLDIAEELNLLTSAVRATAVSRMLNGMLLLPSEASPPPIESGNDDDPEQSPFLQMFIEHVKAQIENPGSAEAKLPYLLEAGYEYLDQVRWLQMHDPQSDYLERDLRIEAIKRLGLGLDMPPEALEGFSNTNHWAAQQIQWDMWRTHGIPVADRFAGDVCDAILRPALQAQDAEWENVGIGYDDSQVVISPDQTAVADEAMDRAAISFDGYRKMKGIPEDYAPSKEEQQFVFGIKTRDPVVAGLEKEATPVRGPTPGPGASQNGKSNVPDAPTGGRVVSRQEAMVASIEGAARLAIRQCRSRAGMKLRSQVTRPPGHQPVCPECQQTIDGIPNAIVASALGSEMIDTLAQSDPIALVQGGTGDFKGIMEEWGIGRADVAVLAERIEAYAAKTLFEPNTPPLPPGFTAHIEHALEMAERNPEPEVVT